MEVTHQEPAATVFRNEFKKENIRLSHHTHEAFYKTQWNWPQIIFVVYRIFAALYILGWLIYSVVLMPVFEVNDTGHVWPAFLTNWSYTVLSVYLIAAAAVVIRRHFFDPKRTEGQFAATTEVTDVSGQVQVTGDRAMPLDLKIVWALFAIIANFAFIVTLIYFGILYPRKVKITGNTKIHPVDLHIHGINSVFILIEMVIAAYPVRLLHCVYPIAYGMTYVLFSLIYWAVDHGNVIYVGVLDWNKPGTTIGVILGLGFIVIPLFQLMLFGMYRLRLWIHSYIYRDKRVQTSPITDRDHVDEISI